MNLAPRPPAASAPAPNKNCRRLIVPRSVFSVSELCVVVRQFASKKFHYAFLPAASSKIASLGAHVRYVRRGSRRSPPAIDQPRVAIGPRHAAPACPSPANAGGPHARQRFEQVANGVLGELAALVRRGPEPGEPCPVVAG